MRSDDLVLATVEGGLAGFGLPDSGVFATVIAPDLSNLPPGQTAINVETGEPVDTPSELPPADPNFGKPPEERE